MRCMCEFKKKLKMKFERARTQFFPQIFPSRKNAQWLLRKPLLKLFLRCFYDVFNAFFLRSLYTLFTLLLRAVIIVCV